jgi:UDP-N-acetylmuramate dehydrogenase
VTRTLVGAALADRTTLRVGGPAARLVTASTAAEVCEVVGECDARGEPVLVLGGGSNLLVSDEGFAGTVVEVATRGVETSAAGVVTVAAGEDWDGVVARTVDEGLAGIECLSGIPGSTGATPVQNVGAYGQEVAQTLRHLVAYERPTREVRTLGPDDCGFAYRHSRFKAEPGRWVVLEVGFTLDPSDSSAPVAYAELARTLGVELGARAALADVRAAVLALRRRKGMVLDPADHDTWSAGSFFTNPVLDPALASTLPAGAPRWPQADGRVKTSAAWLIEASGFGKGYGSGAARLSGKHPLALTNRGGATATELVALAREVRDGVRERFGIELVNEPVLVGLEL